MNRRGYVFSILALILIVIIFSASVRNQEQAIIAEQYLDSPVLNANQFLEQFSKDVPRAVRITAYRSLLGLEEHISAQGTYIENLSAAFSEVLMNGTVNGTSYPIMDDATLSVFLLRMQEMAAQRNMDLDLTVQDVFIEHDSAFTIQVTAYIGINASIPGARWEYTEVVEDVFSIHDLKDPFFTVGTLGRVPRVVTIANVSRPYITAENDTTTLQVLINEGLYVTTPLAPSFLMRFTGNFSAHQHGIASLVDTVVIDSQDLAVFSSKSVVDHVYFGPMPASEYTVHTIINMPSWFLLDHDHLPVFDAEGKTT